MPGTLARLASALGGVGGNVVGIDIHGGDSAHVNDDLYVDVPGPLTPDTLRDVLAAAAECETPVHVRQARAQELVDGPSHALALAARLVADPGCLPQLLCQLVGADSADLTRQPPEEDGHQLVVAAPGDEGYVVVRRGWAPFTLTERARVDRLVGCAAAVRGERSQAGHRALLRDGAEILVRTGGRADVGPVADLLHRCSAPTRRQRFMSTTDRLPADLLQQLACPPDGFAVLAFAESGALIGMAQCLPYADEPRARRDPRPVGAVGSGAVGSGAVGSGAVGSGAVGSGAVPEGSAPGPVADGGRGCHEIALLVADGWQRRGVGTLLLRSVVRRAIAAEIDEIVAISQLDHDGAERVFTRAGLATLVRSVDGVREVRARLRPVRRTSAVPTVGMVSAAAPGVRPAVATGPARELSSTTAVLRGQHALRAWARSHRR